MKKNTTTNMLFSGIPFYYDVFLVIALSISLFLHFSTIFSLHLSVFAFLSIMGLLPVIRSALFALLRKQLTIDLLASIALVFSIFASEWYSACFISLMITFARIFDYWTAMRTKHIIEHLLKFRPETVRIKKNDEIIQISVKDVKKDDIVVVDDGERIPVDGTILSGQASIDESTLTGESVPVVKKEGDFVYTSTFNELGSLLIRAEKVGDDSRLAKIISLIEGASRKKTNFERIAGKFTQWYIFIMVVGSAFLYYFFHDTSLVLAVLLVVCADDIAVAVPLTFTFAIARGVQRGILIKGANVLEVLCRVRYFITDKTGTLTFGRQKIREVTILPGYTEIQFLSYLGTAAIGSRHPIDISIIKYIREKNIDILAPESFVETPGEGVIAELNKKKIVIGRIGFLIENGIDINESQRNTLSHTKERGLALSALGVDKKLIGFLGFEDELRPFSYHLVSITKMLGVRSWTMLTGDNEQVAFKVSNELHIDHFKANLKPEGKLSYIEKFKANHKGVIAMMGDGVNDSAALALSDVSFAMGAIGSDAAIEASDIALTNDQLNRIPEAILLSQQTITIIKQNFIIWGITNIVGLVLVFLGVLHPVGASAYNFITDFFPIFNSLRMARFSVKHTLYNELLSKH